MLITVSKKNTLNRLSGQFGAFARSKENIANTIKQTKRRVIRRTTGETLERNTTLQGGRRLNINEINRCRDSLRLEMRRKRRGNHHCTSGLKKMTMLMLSNAILSMCARAGELSKIALLSKNTTQLLGDILTSRVSTE
jgi:hypothetical protein